MKRLVTAQEMSRIDSEAQSTFGIPDTILMENAGQTAWRALSRRLGNEYPLRVLFLAGKGNNGGDALVMARACASEGRHQPRILLAKEPEDGLSKLHLDICRNLGIPVSVWGPDTKTQIEDADCVVDGLLGTGISGPGRDPLGDMSKALEKASDNRRSKASHPLRRGLFVAAVDVPSGLWDGYQDGHPIVSASLTLTLGLPKRSLYLPAARRHAGEILPLNIGFPRTLTEDPAIPGLLVEEEDVRELVPPLDAEDYKHRRGVVAVFAGAPGTLGAGILSATAAGRGGAGLVRLFVDPELYSAAAGACRSIMVGQTDPEVAPSLEGYDAYVAGPGWSENPLRLGLLENCIHSGLPGVLDAGALAILPKGYRSEGENTVLTPHPAEFSRLSGVSREALMADPLSPMLDLASDRRSVVVLKSHVTYVASPDGRHGVFDGVNGALGTGGTGDILAGIIGAFLARGVSPFEAAIAAVALHGRVGRRTYARQGWFLAEDMLEELSMVLGDMVGMNDYSIAHEG